MTRMRVGLLAVLAVLAAALVVPSVVAQFPPRPGPGPGVPGGPGMTPPIGPGRIPGGGFTPPNFPRPNFPDIPRGPQFESVWTCSGCGKEIGRGNFPPDTCPHCGARIINGIGNGDKPAQPESGPGGFVPPGGGLSPVTPNPGRPTTPVSPPQPSTPPVVELPPRNGNQPGYTPPNGGDFNDQGGWQPTTVNPPQDPFPLQGGADSPSSGSSNSVKKSPSEGTAVMVTAIAVIAGAVLVMILAVVFWIVFLTNASKSNAGRKALKPRRRRRPVYDDDDDDDDDDRPRRRRY